MLSFLIFFRKSYHWYTNCYICSSCLAFSIAFDDFLRLNYDISDTAIVARKSANGIEKILGLLSAALLRLNDYACLGKFLHRIGKVCGIYLHQVDLRRDYGSMRLHMSRLNDMSV